MKLRLKAVIILITIASVLTISSIVHIAFAQQQTENQINYYQAKVKEVLEDGYKDITGSKQPYQKLKIVILNGDLKGREMEVENGGEFSIAEEQRVKRGDKIVISETNDIDGNSVFIISDKYRTGQVILLIVAFSILAVIAAGRRGITSIIGLFFSVLIISNFLIPRILAGDNPTLISYIATLLIAVVSLYLAHGFNKNTSLSLISTLITLFISIILSNIAVRMTGLTGAGSEESMFLQLNQNINISLKGLLLGGIILGVLGVLDDITTAQTSVVHEIKNANPRLPLGEIYSRAANVGKEHITSLINTLFLAYAGVSLPLFLLFKINNFQPAWVIFNSEFIVEEVVRTVVGSMSLILAVPLSTFIAAYYYNKQRTVTN